MGRTRTVVVIGIAVVFVVLFWFVGVPWAWRGLGTNEPAVSGQVCAYASRTGEEMVRVHAAFEAMRSELGNAGALDGAIEDLRRIQDRVAGSDPEEITGRRLRSEALETASRALELMRAWRMGRDGQAEAANYLGALETVTEDVAGTRRLYDCD